MTLMRFLDVIRGVLTAAPTKLLPVMKMPLLRFRDDDEKNERLSARRGRETASFSLSFARWLFFFRVPHTHTHTRAFFTAR